MKQRSVDVIAPTTNVFLQWKNGRRVVAAALPRQALGKHLTTATLNAETDAEKCLGESSDEYIIGEGRD